MSKRIKITYECSMCLAVCEVKPIKPSHFQKTRAWSTCEVCGTKFHFEFQPVKGKPGYTQTDSIEVRPSDFGLEKLRERNAEKEAQNAPSSLAPRE